MESNSSQNAGSEVFLDEKPETNPETKKDRILDIIAALCRFILGGAWVYAGATKLGNHMVMTQTIEAYEIFTPYWSNILAQLIGPLEIAGGLLLLAGLWIRPAGIVSLVVLALFMIGISQAWSRGLVIDCGCFNPAQSEGGMDYLLTLLRDAVYVVMTAFMIYRPFKRWAIYP
ncbi:MauE/DoxX family redox-associated membrane protein [Corynebacterium breve]